MFILSFSLGNLLRPRLCLEDIIVSSIKSKPRHGGTAIIIRVFDFEANMNDFPFQGNRR